MMTPAIRNTVVGFTIAVTTAVALHASFGPQVQAGPAAPPAAAKPAAKPAKGVPGEAWPDTKTIETRRLGAENRKLFNGTEAFPITITGDWKGINSDKNPVNKKVFPATIEFATEDGKTKSVPVQIKTRGHSRLQICFEPPLRLEFQKEDVKGTMFDGIGSIKLGVHCRSDFEDYVIREYANYKIYQLLTPMSFRARLAHATYIDVKTKKPLETRYAMFIEDDDDVARRMSGRLTDQKDLKFVQVDLKTVTNLSLFEYMISNLDMSLAAQHNIRIAELPTGVRYPIPYDFDYSGLVNADYAVPPQNLQAQYHLESVRTRLYRGPCLPQADLEPYFAQFRAIRNDVLAMYDALPLLKSGYRSDSKRYLDAFFHTLDHPDMAKKEFVDGCHRVGM
jgi:hypothetical protein